MRVYSGMVILAAVAHTIPWQHVYRHRHPPLEGGLSSATSSHVSSTSVASSTCVVCYRTTVVTCEIMVRTLVFRKLWRVYIHARACRFRQRMCVYIVARSAALRGAARATMCAGRLCVRHAFACSHSRPVVPACYADGMCYTGADCMTRR